MYTRYTIKQGVRVKAFKSIYGITIILVMVSLITNPLSNQYVIQTMDWVLVWLASNVGAWASIATAIWVTGLMVYLYIQSEKINVPSKTAKTKPQNYTKTT